MLSPVRIPEVFRIAWLLSEVISATPRQTRTSGITITGAPLEQEDPLEKTLRLLYNHNRL